MKNLIVSSRLLNLIKESVDEYGDKIETTLEYLISNNESSQNLAKDLIYEHIPENVFINQMDDKFSDIFWGLWRIYPKDLSIDKIIDKLVYLSKRERLEFNNTPLPTIPKNIKYFCNVNLKHLEFMWNGLSRLQSGDLDGLENLKSLDIGGCNIKTLPAGLFSNMKNLVRLSLVDNETQTIESGAFSNDSNLEEISLSHNNIDYKSILNLPNFNRLESINLSYNNIPEEYHQSIEKKFPKAIIDIQK